jgi:TetR/AcrR family transcriptional repressor of nem operon
MPNKIAFSTAEILKKITILFHSKGYYATSMQDIVEVCQLNRSSIYNTFGSKLELFMSCFDSSEKNYRREIQKIILSVTNPLKSIRDILELSLNETVNGCLIPNYTIEIKNKEALIQKMIKSHKVYLLDLFEDIVKKGQELGTIKNSKSSKQYANFLLTSYFGFQALKNFSNREDELENVIYDILFVIER